MSNPSSPESSQEGPLPSTFSAWRVHRLGETSDAGRSKPGSESRFETLELDALPSGDVLVRVLCSSLNYKDALGFRGHPGVIRAWPQMLGIDLVGEVVSSEAEGFRAGDRVLATGNGLGTECGGGWSTWMRLDSSSLFPACESLTATQWMALGTAGLTAMLSILGLERNGADPSKGPVLVTGATGGVGCLAVQLLAGLGYEVAALTGKAELAGWLQGLGAKTVLDRREWFSDKPAALRSGRWAAAIDTVGGQPLAQLLTEIQPQGVVAACGNAAGDQLQTTVYPWILRGITLVGIDSALAPRRLREMAWQRLQSASLRPVDTWVSVIQPNEVPGAVESMLKGESQGRTVIEFAAEGG